jgi:hypothetical protein
MILNLSKLIKLQDRPLVLEIDEEGSKYEYFNYVLPTEFLTNGTAQLRSMSGNYHQNTFGFKFTFENADGAEPVETPQFGSTKLSYDPYAYVK